NDSVDLYNANISNISIKSSQNQVYHGLTYLNIFSLAIVVVWTLASMISLYCLWQSFNLFQQEVQDVTYEIVDFHTNDSDAKPREVFRLTNLQDLSRPHIQQHASKQRPPPPTRQTRTVPNLIKHV
ncbi:unnamed protein product, partial [Didymodactylos carnosus]